MLINLNFTNLIYKVPNMKFIVFLKFEPIIY